MKVLASKGERAGACQHVHPDDLVQVHVIRFLDGPAPMSRTPVSTIGKGAKEDDVTLDCMLLCDECASRHYMSVDTLDSEKGDVAPIDHDFVLDVDIYALEAN